MRRRALLIDRDGTVCEDVGYLVTPDQLRLLPGSARAIVAAAEAGFQIVLVTNQAGVGHGRLDELGLDRIHDHLRELLAVEGARLDGIYYCPHHPEAAVPRYRVDCPCRKPRPGLLLRARDEMGIDLDSSYMVGDHMRDVEAGIRAGATSLLVLTGHGQRSWNGGAPASEVRPARVANDLDQAVRWILEDQVERGTSSGSSR